jgi:antitoxin component of MazEF toxin-antitoxin module
MSDKDIRLRATVGKWGNSAAVRIPVTKQQLNLEDLLAQITPSNLHGEVQFGRPVGQEIL